MSVLANRDTQMESLAAQITQNVHDHGSIVMFTPVTARMNIESLVGELARHFANSAIAFWSSTPVPEIQ